MEKLEAAWREIRLKDKPPEVDPAWAKERRIEYLNNRRRELLARMVSNRIADGKVVMKGTRADSEFTLAMLKNDAIEKELKKIEKELKFRWIENKDGAPTDHEIETAKNYPVWRLIDKKEGDRIPCPFHRGKDKNMRLYQIKAYCFVCHKNANAVDWLMKDGVKFIEAVRSLQG